MPVDFTNLGGWVEDRAAVERVLESLPMPLFGAAAPHLFGLAMPKTTLLYKAFKEVIGSYPAYVAQKIGDCVSMGFGHGVDLLQCVEIAMGGEAEAFEYTSTEAVYGMARVDIGGGRLGNGDGAVGAWAAKAVSTIGTVSRKVAGEYSGERAKSWGRSGVPADIKSQAGAHKVKTVSLVASWEEAKVAIANGYPVTICSDQGFTMNRDANGFCRPSGSWNHCMLLCGFREDEHPGGFIFQSWGPDTPSGPLSLDQPGNTFCAETSVVDRMIRQGDSWALSAFDGYPGRPLPASWTYDSMA